MLKDIINAAKDFVDREEELEELKKSKESLKNQKPRHIAITGARRLGKTYLSYKYIQKSLSKDIIPIYIDVLYKRNWSGLCDEIIKSMIENYTYCSGKKLRVEKFSKWFTGKFQEITERLSKIEAEIGNATGTYLKLRLSIEKSEDEIELVKATLKSLEEFSEKRNVHIILILDEFQHVEKFSNMAETIAVMRSVIQFQKRMQYIFSGSSTTFINKIFAKSTSAFWRQVEIYSLSPFDAKATKKLAKLWNIDLGEKEIDLLKKLTKGIPDYIVKTMERISDIKNPDCNDIKYAFQEIAERETPLFSDLFERLTTLQQGVLLILAKEKNQYKELEDELGRKVGGILHQMINAQLIERVEKGKYDIFDPLFKEFIKNRISLG
ncbi:MAG: ATP-binding protein [Candidatus Thermoplasmatota archaeon]|nr:ATP-binding protein [Candidatus Thermoplasmatota archaeon]